MKIYAMMYRNKWKDAVDLFYILQKNPELKFGGLIQKTEQIFTDLFQKEAALETILEDKWDTSEAVEYVAKAVFSDKEIRETLIKYAQDFCL